MSRDVMPKAALIPMTDEAKAAIDGGEYVAVEAFPFRIGREERTNLIARAIASVERRLGTVSQVNDLYLLDSASAPESCQISRRHCEIEYQQGRFFLVDRASATGCTVLKARGAGFPPVETQVGGGGFDARTELQNGDFIVLGTRNSPFVFRFQVESVPEPAAFASRSVVVIDADFFSHD
jgi:pSer/pThr/pTyr-binding forkhead associated (FHA) protein